jgi:hypothetical protein
VSVIIFYVVWGASIFFSGWCFHRAHRRAWIGLLLGTFLFFIGAVISLAVLSFYRRQPPVNLDRQLHIAALEDGIYGEIVSPEARQAVRDWHDEHSQAGTS